MNKYGYVSGMADEMTLYIDYKVRSGFMEKSYIHRMRKFDRFCAARGITDISFTEDDSRAWGEKRPDEAEYCHYDRINLVKNFMIYLSRKGYSYISPRISNRFLQHSHRTSIRMMKSQDILRLLTLMIRNAETGKTESSFLCYSAYFTAAGQDLMKLLG